MGKSGKYVSGRRLAGLAVVFLVAVLAVTCATEAAVYEVGPGRELSTLGAVPWESLEAGDTVLIHWSETPYNEKFAIGVAGTKKAPITVRGVPGPAGELPVIDGRGARTRAGLAFYNENRSIIQLGGLRGSDTIPANIVIENLDLRGARTPYTFKDSAGKEIPYMEIASAVRFLACDGVTVRNCIIRDTGNGTISSPGTKNISIEGCHYYDNGKEGAKGVYIHQTYTETMGMLYQYNHFGPLRAGCIGSNLKDRSSGNIIRYNWIEGGNKQIDIPDSHDSEETRNDPRYRETFVYGNVLIEHEGDGNPEMVTYGGDMGDPSRYRNGTLYFYNNTVISHRSDKWFLLKLKTNDESADVRNNIIYGTGPGGNCAMSGWAGTLRMSHNWLKPGWKHSHAGDEFEGEVIDDGTQITGETPGFADFEAQDLHLAAGSPCVDGGTALHDDALPDNDVKLQYVRHRKVEPRPSDGSIDIGAFEYVAAGGTAE
ncbi:MAG: right-handed parallel beta-helix repeat-containing protein [Planctomycetota bacterium]